MLYIEILANFVDGENMIFNIFSTILLSQRISAFLTV